jgi:hypothetical protein
MNHPHTTVPSSRNNTARCLIALFAILGLAAADTAATKKQLIELTGGRRVKVAWNQGNEGQEPSTFRYFDTKDGKIHDLPFAGTAGDAVFRSVWFTADGRHIIAQAGKDDSDRTLVMYDTDTAKVTELAKGPDNNPLAIWRDPKTGRDWVYVNDCGAGGDRQRAWDAGRDRIYRIPLDKPEERELFWDRTTCHEFFTLSADGMRACMSPRFFNIGVLKLAYDAKGGVDQDKSEFQSYGGGCFPGMSPDNSYRWFRLDGQHKSIDVFDTDSSEPRKVDVTGMPGVGENGKQVWLTRWSTHPRVITLMGPDSQEARIWLGRFDKDFTKIEAWVQVNHEGSKSWKSHAWIDSKPST